MVGRSHHLGLKSESDIYLSGVELIALKNEGPHIKKGLNYTIEKYIIYPCQGKSQENLVLKLKGVDGIYSTQTFKLVQESKALQ